MAAGSTAFYQPHGTRLPPTHCSELNHASMCDDHKDEGKTHCKNSQWDGWDMRPFFSQDLAGRGNGTVLSLLGLFFIAPLAALQGTDPCPAMAR